MDSKLHGRILLPLCWAGGAQRARVFFPLPVVSQIREILSDLTHMVAKYTSCFPTYQELQKQRLTYPEQAATHGGWGCARLGG